MEDKPFRLRATFTIEIDAPDAYAVSDHRRELAAVQAGLEERFGAVQLSITARRPRTKPRAAPPPQVGPGFEIVRVRCVR